MLSQGVITTMKRILVAGLQTNILPPSMSLSFEACRSLWNPWPYIALSYNPRLPLLLFLSSSIVLSA